MPSDPQWYEPKGGWPGIVVVAQLLSAIVAPLAVGIALWGDWLKDRFGWRGRTQLAIEVDAPARYHWGWIENAVAVATPRDWAGAQPDGRLKVHFFRAKITNHGHVAAKSVTLWVKRLESTESRNKEKALENVMPLRWSDLWRFNTDATLGKVTGSETEIGFPTLPAGSSKYCDLCFFLDQSGPTKVGGFETGRLYLSVLNLPSSSYSMTTGPYKLDLHLSAENCRPVDIVVDLDYDATRGVVKIIPQSSGRPVRRTAD